ncbi:MACPF domain-containing protein CAD1 [Linum perenne]
MGESGIGTAAALHTAINSVQALGRGFDVNYDTRLLYCKGVAGSRVVQIDQDHTRDLFLYDDVVVPHVSRDIRNSPGSHGRQSSGVCTFNEMVEYFNKKANLSGSSPIGSFNSAFSFSGSKHIDASITKTLSMDGYYIPLAKVELFRLPLVLQENVKRAVPTCWDPAQLASFIETFGTHVITSVTVGGKDVIFVKQHQSSALTKMEMKSYVQDVGNQRFWGGDDLEQNHIRWARTVRASPDVVHMTFVPITDLLNTPGKDHLARAIGLYLEYKPQIEELRYFLEFQIPRFWSPVRDSIPGHQRKDPVCQSLQFSIMGPKLYVSQEQISVGRKPVTGLRLCLEGAKQNRLSIHVQHLVSLPKILLPYWDTHVAIGAPKWQGPEEQDSRWFEPVKWKNFSHVSTAPIENPETFIGDNVGVFVVTGAQLGVWDFGSRNVLYMKLLYSRLPGCTIRRSLWDHTPNHNNNKVKKQLSSVNSSSNAGAGDSSSGETENHQSSVGKKLMKFVDMSEMSKGPRDPPGHWLVTGGKLGVEKGKIVLRVKYSLLNY